MILVPLLNPKFATLPAEKSCELRVRGTKYCYHSRNMWKQRPRTLAPESRHIVVVVRVDTISRAADCFLSFVGVHASPTAALRCRRRKRDSAGRLSAPRSGRNKDKETM